MFKISKTKQIEKILAKALKKANKEIKNNKLYQGRFIIRDCFHQVAQTKEKGLLMSYCFECVDKATGFRKFYQFDTKSFDNVATIEKFEKILKEIIAKFSTKCPDLPTKDYRHIKVV